ncbi:MAG: hypothetical protein ACRDZ8_00470 [Acidimicrobiales bacterium]
MATDQPNLTDQTDYFLEYLLRCALTAPGAQTSPTAGRILARLLVVGAVEYGDTLVTPYLVPVPGDDATFEVRAYQPGDLVPTDVREGLPAAAALKIALRSARESDDGIEVVSRNSDGVERCVLVRDSTGDFEFRFAGPETLVGDTSECAAAKAQWEATLARWRESTPIGSAPGGRLRATVATASRPVAWPRDGDERADDALRTVGTREPPPDAGWWMPGGAAGGTAGGYQPVATGGVEEASGSVAEAAAASEVVPVAPLAEEIGVGPPPAGGTEGFDAAARVAPAGSAPVTPVGAEASSGSRPYDGAAGSPNPVLGVDAPPRGAPGVGGPSLAAGYGVDAPGRYPEGFLASAVSAPGDEDALTAAVREAIANLVVEVDLSQVEQLLRRVLEDDHREMVEPLARRLSARIGEALDRPDPTVFAQVLAQVVPHPVDLAEAVAADVGALLSETILRRRTGDSGAGMDTFNLMVGIEQLQVRLDGLQDQLQRSAGLLEAMTDHLEAGDRRAAIAERVATSIDQEMQRLANRIDEQVAAIIATSGGGSDATDGVARLTRKLRQSVAQFDRVLERMDAAFELPESAVGPSDEIDEPALPDEPDPALPDEPDPSIPLRYPRDRVVRTDRPAPRSPLPTQWRNLS